MPDEVIQARAAAWLRDSLGEASLEWALALDPALGVSPESLGLVVEGTSGAELFGAGPALLYGTLAGQRVGVCGGGPPAHAEPLHALLSHGAHAVCLVFAAFGLEAHLRVGELVLVRDHIGILGPAPPPGPRPIEPGRLYCPQLRARVQAIHPGIGPTRLAEAVFIHSGGPHDPTPAEAVALSRLGGEVTGASLTYEAVLAASHGASVCAIGAVTRAPNQDELPPGEVELRRGETQAELAGLLRGLLAGPAGP